MTSLIIIYLFILVFLSISISSICEDYDTFMNKKSIAITDLELSNDVNLDSSQRIRIPTSELLSDEWIEELTTILSNEELLILPTAEPSSRLTQIRSSISILPSINPTLIPTEDPTILPTIEPSAILSDEPSMLPSSNSSEIFTVDPTIFATFQPTVTLTNETSILPNNKGIPTESPTISPTLELSKISSHEPSLLPSINPTLIPTEDPTILPTIEPSAILSDEPSMLPSSNSSEIFTIDQTIFPSVEPSARENSLLPSASSTVSQSTSNFPTAITSISSYMHHPSTLPSLLSKPNVSLVPSINPSSLHEASMLPSINPSYGLTSSPTSSPTIATSLDKGKTYLPSTYPTLSPSLSLESKWKLILGEIIDFTDTMQSNYSYSSKYFELSVSSSHPSKLYGSCDGWKSLLLGDLSLSMILYRPAFLSFTVQDSIDSQKPSVIVCEDLKSVKEIMSYLTTETIPTTLISVMCSGYKWVMQWCDRSKAPAICIDCKNPCSNSMFYSNNTNNNFISPCTTSSIASSSVKVLSFSYTDLDLAPVVISSELISTTKSSISLKLELSKSGIASCAAYIINPNTGIHYVPTLNEIKNQNSAVLSDSKNISLISINNLYAVTDYQIYCLSQSFKGAQTKLSDVIRNSFQVNTSCCSSISTQILSANIQPSQNILNYLTITVDSLPNSDMSVLIKLNNLVATNFIPSSFKVPALIFTSTFSNNKVSQYTSSYMSIPNGSYMYSLDLIGDSKSKYEVNYGGHSNLIRVLTSTDKPPAPVFISTTYSNDGSHIIALFDSNTDRGGLASKFPCNELFYFNCSSTSTCYWINDKQVDIYIKYSPSCATIRDTITLKTSKIKIRAQCQSNSCNSLTWPYTENVNRTIEVSENAIYPSIEIISPDTIGKCDSLMIDVSASSGDGGNPWNRIDVTVNTDATENIDALRYFLEHTYTISPPTLIESKLLIPGFSYNFMITICNFMLKCSQRSKKIIKLTKIIPTVSIPGSSFRGVSRNKNLIVSSTSSLVLCNQPATQEGLQYNWVISRKGNSELSLVSISKDPSILLLPSYSLMVGSTYDVQIQVTITATLQSSFTKIEVYVKPGNLVPVILLGLYRSVRIDDGLFLDGSRSYDEDILGLFGLDANLEYNWDCIQTAPEMSSSCNSAINIQKSEPFIYSFIAIKISELQVQLTISDLMKVRSASLSISVSIKSSLSPLVSVDYVTISSVSKINAENTMRLIGKVSLPDSYNGTATWSVDNSLFDLSKASKSTLVNQIAASKVSTQTNNFYLVIIPNTLPTGAILNFILTADIGISYPSMSKITVQVNAPPLAGIFGVIPYEGKELVDSFTFYANQWYDEDIPLNYQFNYYAASGNKISLSLLSETALYKTILPGGVKSSNFILACSVDVYDSFSASSSLSHNIIVHTSNISSDPQLLNNYVMNSLNKKFSTPNSLKQASALSSYLLNIVNCTLAPNCVALNRKECSQTENTCGECISDEYIGESGDSNDACSLHLIDNSSRKTLQRILSPPNVLKECNLNCSSNGHCSFTNIDSGEKVSTCYVGAIDCKATCECKYPYFGSMFCSMTTENLETKQSLRHKLIGSIQDLIENEDINTQSVLGWMNLLSISCQNNDEISHETSFLAYNIVQNIMQTSNDINLNVENLVPLLNIIDLLSNNKGISQTNQNHSNVNLTILNNLLEQYRMIASDSMLPGEQGISYAYQNFRLFIQKFSLYYLRSLSDISLNIPLTLNEMAAGISTSSIKVPISSQSNVSDVNINIALTTIRSEYYNSYSQLNNNNINNMEFYSNPLNVEISSNEICYDEASCNIEIEIQTFKSLNEVIKNSIDNNTQFDTLCMQNVNSVHTYACPGESNPLIVYCNATTITTSTYKITSVCPSKIYLPLCNSILGINSTFVEEDICTVISYTDYSVTCSCPIFNQISSFHRNLQDKFNNYSKQYVARILENTKENPTIIIINDNDTNTSSANKSYEAMIVIIVILFFIVLSNLYSYASKDMIVYRVNPITSKLNILSNIKLIESPVPLIYRSISLFKRILDEFKSHHKWLNNKLIQQAKINFQLLHILSLSIKIILMMFFNTITYFWINNKENYQEYNQTMVLCVIFILFITIPFSYLFDICIILLFSNSNWNTKTIQNIKQKTKNIKNNIMFYCNNNKIVHNNEILGDDQYYNQLLDHLHQYANKLCDTDKNNFYASWNLNNQGKWSVEDELIIKNELYFIEQNKLQALKNSKLHTDICIENQIINYFYMDSLSKINQTIFKYKCNRDNYNFEDIINERFSQYKVKDEYYIKSILRLILSCIIIGMMIFIFIYSLKVSTYQQNIWISSLFLTIGIDVCFIQSIHVILMDIYLPGLIISKINEIKLILLNCIGNLINTNANILNDIDYNTSNYYYMSKILSKENPTCIETSIINNYKLVQPTLSSNINLSIENNQHKSQQLNNYSFSSEFKFYLKYIKIFSINHIIIPLLQLSQDVQNLLIEYLITFLIGCITYLHVYYFHTVSVIAFIPLIIMIVIIILLLFIIEYYDIMQRSNLLLHPSVHLDLLSLKIPPNQLIEKLNTLTIRNENNDNDIEVDSINYNESENKLKMAIKHFMNDSSSSSSSSSSDELKNDDDMINDKVVSNNNNEDDDIESNNNDILKNNDCNSINNDHSSNHSNPVNEQDNQDILSLNLILVHWSNVIQNMVTSLNKSTTAATTNTIDRKIDTNTIERGIINPLNPDKFETVFKLNRFKNNKSKVFIHRSSNIINKDNVVKHIDNHKEKEYDDDEEEEDDDDDDDDSYNKKNVGERLLALKEQLMENNMKYMDRHDIHQSDSDEKTSSSDSSVFSDDDDDDDDDDSISQKKKRLTKVDRFSQIGSKLLKNADKNVKFNIARNRNNENDSEDDSDDDDDDVNSTNNDDDISNNKKKSYQLKKISNNPSIFLERRSAKYTGTNKK